jgi:hypothetical protein
MPQFQFVGSSFNARSKNFDAQRTVNMYLERATNGAAKYPAMLIGTPGLAVWANVDSSGGVRCVHRFSATGSYVVSGENVYRVNSDTTVQFIGTIPFANTPVSMADNGQVTVLVDGANGYVINHTTNAMTQITDPDFVGANFVVFLDGYFVFNKPGTGQFYITALYSTAIDQLDFATAEGSPDLLVSILADHRELWLFGETTTEVWFNSGNPDFPFERIQGAFIEHGIAAARSAAKLDNTVFWLGADDNGYGVVMKANGYQPERISNHAVEFAMQNYPTYTDAVAFTYQQEGHSFYVLNFPTADATWVYDAATGEWHERAWRDNSNALHRIRAANHMAFGGKNIVGDWQQGLLYEMSLDTFTDNGFLIPRIRRAPHLSADLKWQFFHKLQIDMETGVGNDAGAQGSDPKAMLRWSNDGGHTWSNEMWSSIGKIGEYRARAIWRRLGRGRDRVFEVTITDPVKVCIIGATAEVTVGSS